MATRPHIGFGGFRVLVFRVLRRILEFQGFRVWGLKGLGL